MCELHIGYFKIEDAVDSSGRFRSKFKVLFKRCMFIYDFPVAKCNQLDLSNSYSWEQMARIQVPFKTVAAMNMGNRLITFRVNCCPQVYLKRLPDWTSEGKGHADNTVNDSIWIDAVRNSPIHKITLRKRQADNLKSYLCQFDSRFVSLLRKECSTIGDGTISPPPFEEELATVNLGKIYQKNRRNAIRRLPQWDKEADFDTIDLEEEGDLHLVSSNLFCSCRVSCKSLRCSCVKAAKSCSTGENLCLCVNCDNPLNLLQSMGMDLEFSLRDCCLFQNIYQIPKLDAFLQRDVKLSCCNTIARVGDCIPGTVLCPNMECNACLEFSWCRGIICYPERNPRNHCSLCGHCCFSNGRHCPVCNRCYVVTSKCLNCPNCRGNGLVLHPLVQEIQLFGTTYKTKVANPDVASSAKSCSKPEIVLLDSSFGLKSGKRDVEVKPGGLPSDKCSSSIQHSGKEKDDVKDDDAFLELYGLLEGDNHDDKQENLDLKDKSSLAVKRKYFDCEENKPDVMEFIESLHNELKSDVGHLLCEDEKEQNPFVPKNNFSKNLEVDHTPEEEGTVSHL